MRAAPRGHGAGAPQAAPLGVFLAGPDAFGFRTYLTTDEARQLAADWVDLLAGFGDRAEDPSRRPDDAVLYEVVVLGRQVPDLVGAARGLPGAADVRRCSPTGTPASTWPARPCPPSGTTRCGWP